MHDFLAVEVSEQVWNSVGAKSLDGGNIRRGVIGDTAGDVLAVGVAYIENVPSLKFPLNSLYSGGQEANVALQQGLSRSRIHQDFPPARIPDSAEHPSFAGFQLFPGGLKPGPDGLALGVPQQRSLRLAIADDQGNPRRRYQAGRLDFGWHAPSGPGIQVLAGRRFYLRVHIFH